MTTEQLSELSHSAAVDLQRTKNSFTQKIDGYTVEIGYAEDVQETLEERMVQLIRRQTAVL